MIKLDPYKKIGIVSPSWNGPGLFPHVFEIGIKEVKRIFSKEVLYSKYCIKKELPTPIERAQDLHSMFENNDVDLIIASIGGSDSHKLLPFLDKQLIRSYAEGKKFMGYSDSTTLLLYLRTLGVQTIHGPTIMSGFSEMSGVAKELEKHMRDFFNFEGNLYQYPNFKTSTDKNNPWEDVDMFRDGSTIYDTENDWHILQEGEAVAGQLIGGNIETIYSLIESSNFENLTENYLEPIIFFESSEEKPSIDYLRVFLHEQPVKDLIMRSVAVIFGYWSYYSLEEKEGIRQMLKEVLIDEYKYDGVVVSDLPIGHSRPQWLLLEGGNYSLSSSDKLLSYHR